MLAHTFTLISAHSLLDLIIILHTAHTEHDRETHADRQTDRHMAVHSVCLYGGDNALDLTTNCTLCDDAGFVKRPHLQQTGPNSERPGQSKLMTNKKLCYGTVVSGSVVGLLEKM